MKIGFILYGKADERSGGFLYDSYLIQTLKDAGHSVKIFSQKEGSFFSLLLQNSNSFLNRLLDYEPDLIIEDELNHTSLFLINKIIKSKYDIPIITIVHHLRSEEKISRIQKYIYKKIEHSFLENCNAFIFNSISTLNTVLSLIQKQIINYKIVYPGMDYLPYIKRVKHDDNILRFLFVGNIIPRKNIDLVLRVLYRIPADNWQFTICGADYYNKNYVKRIHNLASQFNNSKNIIFKGRIPNNELADLMSESDILLAPSNFEGFGITYLEALRAGVIPIASHNGGASEIIENNVNGFLINPENEYELKILLKELIEKPEIISKLRISNNSKFKSWGETMKDALTFIESIQK